MKKFLLLLSFLCSSIIYICYASIPLQVGNVYEFTVVEAKNSKYHWMVTKQDAKYIHVRQEEVGTTKDGDKIIKFIVKGKIPGTTNFRVEYQLKAVPEKHSQAKEFTINIT